MGWCGLPRSTATEPEELEDIEVRLLLEGVFRRYGYDFRDYSYSSLKRRVLEAVSAEGVATVSALQEKVLHDPGALARFLLAASVNWTQMFRDPPFFLALRTKVVPYLRTYPFIRIWHAGCSTGEEVYSMAILLEEEGLYDRCRLYVTDFSDAMVAQARTGIFPLSVMREYSQNYVMAGGKGSLSDYYTARYDHAILDSKLRRNVVFAQHNLVSDGSFNEFHVILCRNVILYFNDRLRDRAHRLLYSSLAMFGFLGLGHGESVKFTPHADCYEEADGSSRLYRKVR